MSDPKAMALGGGVAIFLLGEALFRRTLGLGAASGRALTAVLALATIPIGLGISAVAAVGVLVLLLIGMLVGESAAYRGPVDEAAVAAPRRR